MTELQQRIIEALIFEPRTAEDLAAAFDMYLDDIVDALLALETQGAVCPQFPHVLGDSVCAQTGVDLDCPSGAACPQCNGPVIDACIWTYCGGPISKALEAA